MHGDGAFYERICGYSECISVSNIQGASEPRRITRRRAAGDILYKILREAFVTARYRRLEISAGGTARALQQMSRGKLLTQTFTLACIVRT